MTLRVEPEAPEEEEKRPQPLTVAVEELEEIVGLLVSIRKTTRKDDLLVGTRTYHFNQTRKWYMCSDKKCVGKVLLRGDKTYWLTRCTKHQV